MKNKMFIIFCLLCLVLITCTKHTVIQKQKVFNRDYEYAQIANNIEPVDFKAGPAPSYFTYFKLPRNVFIKVKVLDIAEGYAKVKIVEAPDSYKDFIDKIGFVPEEKILPIVK
ncbi:MAG TPA: hypothetical protein PLD27_12365 [bacterium]|nr:hypothetical protein [bacterium]HOL48505.1 hypothetical protein [bacterium]HPQ20002.1 hypothetical protein [bacterium]